MNSAISISDFFLNPVKIKLTAGFLERGLLVTDTAQLSKKYVKSVAFYIDIFSIIPTQVRLQPCHSDTVSQCDSDTVSLDRHVDLVARADMSFSLSYLHFYRDQLGVDTDNILHQNSIFCS